MNTKKMHNYSKDVINSFGGRPKPGFFIIGKKRKEKNTVFYFFRGGGGYIEILTQQCYLSANHC